MMKLWKKLQSTMSPDLFQQKLGRIEADAGDKAAVGAQEISRRHWFPAPRRHAKLGRNWRKTIIERGIEKLRLRTRRKPNRAPSSGSPAITFRVLTERQNRPASVNVMAMSVVER